MLSGNTAYRQGKYAEAEKLWKAGLESAESFGTQDSRYGTSLNNLAGLYRAQGRHGEAEPLYKRALDIREKALGPEHPLVALNLEIYAALLRKMGRDSEATRMETLGKAMRPKHPEWMTAEARARKM